VARRLSNEGRSEQLSAKVCGQGCGIRHGAQRHSDVGHRSLVEEARLKGASVKAGEFRWRGGARPKVKKIGARWRTP
jgi:hypothetical protein